MKLKLIKKIRNNRGEFLNCAFDVEAFDKNRMVDEFCESLRPIIERQMKDLENNEVSICLHIYTNEQINHIFSVLNPMARDEKLRTVFEILEF